jgi:hypothetical protein
MEGSLDKKNRPFRANLIQIFFRQVEPANLGIEPAEADDPSFSRFFRACIRISSSADSFLVKPIRFAQVGKKQPNEDRWL